MSGGYTVKRDGTGWDKHKEVYLIQESGHWVDKDDKEHRLTVVVEEWLSESKATARANLLNERKIR